jgi:hypothetical protein
MAISDMHYGKIDEESKRKAILDSGYLLERRVSNLLRHSGYKAITNRGFFDKEKQKSREYDVYAYKEIEIDNSGFCAIYPTLVCECKKKAQPIAFFIHDNEKFVPLIDEVTVSGMPSKIWKRNKYIPIQKFIDVANFHHYCRPATHVATLCCTFENIGKHWNASHGDDLNDTERTLTKALENEIDDDFKNMSQWFIPGETQRDFIDLSFYYPVLVIQGEINAVHVANKEITTNDDLIIENCQHIQYNPEFYSYYDNEVISYHIDVITEAYLPTFLELVEKEMIIVKQTLQRQKNDVMQSIHKITSEIGHSDKKATNYRKQLGYPF